MKRTWLVWALVGAIVITVLIAFNYERGREAVPLSEIFPEKEATNNAVEYEFFDSDETPTATPSTATTKTPVQAPVVAVSVPKKVVTAPAAAKARPAGAAFVAAPAIAPAASTIVPASSAIPGTSTAIGKVYTIQVAAFKEQSRANKAVEQAQQKGYTAFIDQRSKSDGSVWYQICIGRFDGQQAAKELLAKLQQDYKDGYIKILTGH